VDNNINYYKISIMGSCSSKKTPDFNIEDEYRKLNLPMPDPTSFEGSFEKEAFYTANVFRANPKIMIPSIKEAKSKNFTTNFSNRQQALLQGEVVACSD